MKNKISAEEGAKRGVVVGEPYTPPGRTAVFDVPSYDDVADLHELFKRFANTAASYSEAGGNVSTKTAAFTIAQTDIGTTFLCNWATLTDATIGNSFVPQNGMKISFVQLGTGAVQVKALAGQVKGNFTTSGQYQGIQALYADGTWWCVPFGGSGGGGSSDVPVFNVTADTTLSKDYIGGLVAVDVSDNKDKKVTVPLDDGTIPIGSIIVVSNVGPLSVPKVTLEAEDGVIIQDRANDTVLRWRSAALIKRAANLWLINAGSNGGGGTGSVPTAPELIAALPSNESAVLRWAAPLDDGGHSISSYIAESLGAGGDWVPVGVFSGLARTGVVADLNSGEEYTLRVRAENSVGVSDPSETAKVTPAAAYNDAAGGAITEFEFDGKMFRRHTFTTSGTLTVKKSISPFVVAAIGSGGSGGGGFIGASGFAGGDGGGGGAWEAALTLPSGDTAVTIGSGGTASIYNGGGSSGTLTVVSTITVGSGGGGQSGQSIQDSGKNPTPGTKGNQGGTSDGGNGSVATFPGRTIRDKYQLGTVGNGGGGGGQDGPGGGGAGQPGAVVVEYEIAPFNSAVGGQETIIEDYNGTGQTWKVHEFIGDNSLRVLSAQRPFRVLAAAGGGGGGGDQPYTTSSGGGGGGGVLIDDAYIMGEGQHVVKVGLGGAHGGNTERGDQGGNTTFLTFNAIGGGGGGAYADGSTGGSGGSGGGGSNTSNSPGGKGTAGQGFDGAPGWNQGGNPDFQNFGGAGGGAGGPATTPSRDTPSNPGPGLKSNITGVLLEYGIGGAAGNGGGGEGTGFPGSHNGGLVVAYQIAQA